MDNIVYKFCIDVAVTLNLSKEVKFLQILENMSGETAFCHFYAFDTQYPKKIPKIKLTIGPKNSS